MTIWGFIAIIGAVVLITSTAYVLLRWCRAPLARKAMLSVSLASMISGLLLGAAGLHLFVGRPNEVTAPLGTVAPASAAAPAVNPETVLGPVEGAGPTFTGKVVNVIDGDTVDVIGPSNAESRIRLSGIDAPESAQHFGAESTAYLKSLLQDKTAKFECENEKSYGRLICKILLPSGEDVSLDEVKAGMAWHYKQFEDEQTPADRSAYAAAECTAMKAKSGLWGDPHPVQPQDFRHGTDSPLLFGSDGCRRSSEPTNGPVVGNSRSHIFEWPGCPYYSAISPGIQVQFSSPQSAEAAGYRPAHNCP